MGRVPTSNGSALSGLAGPRILDAEPDERLVELVRAGDERAFTAIVERYRAPLLRYCRGHLPPAAAEDALQQTFINAYSALTGDGTRAPVVLRPWLYRVAHNAALNVARDPQSRLAPLHDGIPGVERPDEVVARSERLWRVVGAVRALPAKQRDVIVRHAVEGQTHERIAADLGMSAGSIRQLAHRARRTVRDAAAALLPVGAGRWLPWVESAPAVAGGGTVAKVAVAVVVAGAAGGGAVEIAQRADERPERRAVAARQDRPERSSRPARVVEAVPAPAPVLAAAPPARPDPRPVEREREDSSGRGSSGRSGTVFDSSGSGGGSSGSGSGSGSPGSGSGSSGSGSSGSGFDSSGSGSGSSGSSGSGSSGSSGSGSSGSGSSGSGSSGSGSSGSGSSGSGSSGDDLVEPVVTAEPVRLDSSGPGSGDELEEPEDSSGSGSSGSGSSGSGSSGSG